MTKIYSMYENAKPINNNEKVNFFEIYVVIMTVNFICIRFLYWINCLLFNKTIGTDGIRYGMLAMAVILFWRWRRVK